MTTAVDTDTMERLLALAHTPVLDTDAGEFFLMGLPNTWEDIDLTEIEDPQVQSAIEWARSMRTQCHCGYRAPSSNVGLGPHIRRAITQGLEGDAELV